MTREEFFNSYKDCKGLKRILLNYFEKSDNENPFKINFDKTSEWANMFSKLVGQYQFYNFYREHQREIERLIDDLFGDMTTKQIYDNYNFEYDTPFSIDLHTAYVDIALVETTKELYWDYLHKVKEKGKER